MSYSGKIWVWLARHAPLPQADNVTGSKLSGAEFLKFWVNYDTGRISVGKGRAGHSMLYSWQDATPRSVQHVALSAWDHHLAYRNIQARTR